MGNSELSEIRVAINGKGSSADFQHIQAGELIDQQVVHAVLLMQRFRYGLHRHVYVVSPVEATWLAQAQGHDDVSALKASPKARLAEGSARPCWERNLGASRQELLERTL